MSSPSEFLRRPSLLQVGYLRERLRDETVGGMLLLIAAAIALVWANSPWGASYENLVNYDVGPVSLHLDLPLGVWAADGLLAVFFFVVGLELKHELVLGSLSKVREAVVPAAAALGGVSPRWVMSCTISSRRAKVSRAFLWWFIRSELLEITGGLAISSFSSPVRMDHPHGRNNLLKLHS
jgi:hypothetical protein